jgi:GntR family transcriptional regulator
MPINPKSPIPFYLQLAGILKEKIAAGEYACGSKIPSEHFLESRYGIARPTVRQAIGTLVAQRALERRKGSGTFVRERAPEVDLFSLAGTSSAFLEKGIPLTQKLLKKTSLTGIESDPDNPFNGKKAFFFSRISLIPRAPVLLEETYLDPDFFRGIDRFDFTKESLARLVREHYYLEPSSCRQTFRVVFDKEKSRILKQEASTPLLLVARTLNFPKQDGAVFSRLFCPAGRFTFSQELTGGHIGT